jgi:hypothetical protein
LIYNSVGLLGAILHDGADLARSGSFAMLNLSLIISKIKKFNPDFRIELFIQQTN